MYSRKKASNFAPNFNLFPKYSPTLRSSIFKANPYFLNVFVEFKYYGKIAKFYYLNLRPPRP